MTCHRTFAFSRHLVLGLMVGAAAPSAAQDLTAFAGYSNYDLSGTGSTWIAGAALGLEPVRVLRVEPSIAYFGYTEQFGATQRHLFAELGLYVQATLPRIRPYFGGGVGISQQLSGRDFTDVTLHGATGLRVRLGPRWGARGEFRVRAVHPFGAVTADLTGGVTVRL